MSKVCSECGHPLDDNANVCPNCGCPQENTSYSYSANVNSDVLNKGKSTEAEELIGSLAEKILKYGKIAANIVLIGTIIISAFLFFGNIAYGYGFTGFLSILYVLCIGLPLYASILFFSQAFWGAITLFVNISTTLKRIENKLENGTH